MINDSRYVFWRRRCLNISEWLGSSLFAKEPEGIVSASDATAMPSPSGVSQSWHLTVVKKAGHEVKQVKVGRRGKRSRYLTYRWRCAWWSRNNKNLHFVRIIGAFSEPRPSYWIRWGAVLPAFRRFALSRVCGPNNAIIRRLRLMARQSYLRHEWQSTSWVILSAKHLWTSISVYRYAHHRWGRNANIGWNINVRHAPVREPSKQKTEQLENAIPLMVECLSDCCQSAYP